ncbi:MAG: TOMM system kinase/cyclase fusion protein [Minicystis sp.]
MSSEDPENGRGAAAITPGCVFQGRYEVLSVLREGGFATLYEGRQLTTGQPVAIKVLHRLPGGTPADVARRVARIHREMRFCARLHHPNIVRLIDFGQTDEGWLYTVFELVPGLNLAEVLAREGALDPPEARYLMLQVLDALCCAHAQGVVHRDLKPANIMIVPTGARRNALVLDFGIGAAIASDPEGQEPKLTGSHEILCTPAYAAPEQLRGLPTTARSDLYAWGLVFLECLTGHASIKGNSLPEVLLEQTSVEPVPIPPALLRHPLGALLRRATNKDFTARAASAEGLLHELEACDVSGLRREELADGGERRRDAEEESPWGASFSPTVPEELSARSPSSSEDLAPAAPAALVEGERRPLTAVSCVLTTAGPGLAPADVEEIDEILDEAQRICAEITRRHRGHFTGALGDRVFLDFGCPAARESDARHAARAALAIVSEIGALSARLAAERSIVVEVRVGIHTGLVVAREEEQNQRLQMTTQIASRLSALAGPGAILISRDTYRILRGDFACAETEAQLPLGVTRLAKIYALQKETACSISAPACLAREALSMFGRDQEIELLLQRWGEVQQGAGQIVFLTGGLGVGKTRLTQELARRLGSEVHAYVECRCAADRSHRALHPLIDLLERLLEPARAEPSGGRLERLEALLARHRFPLDDTVPLLAALLSIPLGSRYPPPSDLPLRQKERTLDTLLSLVLEMAEDQPVLFAVEDLQWADPTTLEWLGELVDEVSSARVMALFTARPEFAPPWPTSGTLQIQLGRLPRPQVERMIGQITGDHPLPPEVLEEVIDRADGVPLFVEELIRTVLESGMLREEEGRFVLGEALAQLHIPTTLQALMTARLDRLGRAKETAQVAAAVGREFRFDVLGAVSTIDEGALQDDLDKLTSADFIHRRHRARLPTYMFKHALIRDAVHESIPKRVRARLHARIARTLEERFAEIVESHPEVLALHHAAAGQKKQAILYAERAARLALERPASSADDREAVAHINQALSWLPAIEDTRERAVTELSLDNLLIAAFLDRRGFLARELSTAVKRCQELSEMLGDSALTTPALWATCAYHHIRNHRREARGLAERLVTLAERAGDTGQLVWSLPLLGECLETEGRFGESRAHLERAIALYDPAAHRQHALTYGQDSKANAQAILANVLWFMGSLDQAITMGQAAVAWARELDHPNSLGLSLLYLSAVHRDERQRDKVLEVTAELTALAERYRLWVKDFGWAQRHWAERDIEGLKRRIQAIQDTGLQLGMTYWPSLIAELDAEHGRHEAAIERLEGCLRLADETGEVHYAAELNRLEAASLLAYDARSTADVEARLRRSIALAHGQSASALERRALLDLCRLFRRQGRRDEARALLREAGVWPNARAAAQEEAKIADHRAA